MVSIFSKASLILACAVLLTQSVNAIPSGLDPTFGVNGVVLSSLGDGNDYVQSMAIQDDGKIVAVGRFLASTAVGGGDFAVVRYNPDGSLDTTFGTGGSVSIDFGISRDFATTLALQIDGKIVVGGFSSINGTSNMNDFAVARLNANGTLDSSFDGDGKVTTTVGPNADTIRALAIQSDGKIVVAGISFSTQDEFAIVRYNPNGSLDTTFDGDGKVIRSIGPGNDFANALVIQSDLKIVVAGAAMNSSGLFDFVCVRFNTNGSLDSSFSSDGVAFVDFGSNNEGASGLALQPDGKMVLSGYYASLSNSDDFALCRIGADGNIDSTFGIGGKVSTPFGTGIDQSSGVAVQPDGKIISVGYAFINGASQFVATRHNGNGTADLAFDDDGKVVTELGGPSNQAFCIAIQSDGKILVGGQSNHHVAMLRYMGDPRAIVSNNATITPSDRLNIPGAPPGIPLSSYPSVITINGLPNSITNIRVTLKNITHTFPKDLDVLLVGPEGQNIMLMSDALGNSPGVNGITLIFDTYAQVLPQSNVVNNFGFYRAANYLSDAPPDTGSRTDTFPPPGPETADYGSFNLDVLNGTNPNGDWKLYVVDDANLDTGSIGGWTIDVMAIPTHALVSGRVTAPSGRTISGAVLTLTDNAGVSRIHITNPFGYFRFPNVRTAEVFTIAISSKRYRFNPNSRQMTILDNTNNANFVSEN